MGNLTLNLEWCANWQQDDKFYCTMFIKEDYFNKTAFVKLLDMQFGENYGGWRYDRQRHGIEIWFRKYEDLLAFKMLSQMTDMTELSKI